jgi:AGZA family xanthine/uracil permease-like MFS transporter
MRQVSSVNWIYIGDALPAFVTIACMPLTYSVAYGLIAGLLTYTVLNGSTCLTKLASRGRIQPPDADTGEYGTYKPGAKKPPWFIRAAQGRLWRSGRRGDDSADDDQKSLSGRTENSEKELIMIVVASKNGSRNSNEQTISVNVRENM